MPWLQIHITADKPQVAGIEEALEQLGALSITLLDARDQPMLEPPPGATPLWNLTEIMALFEANTDTDHLRSTLTAILDHDSQQSLRLEMLQDQAWERAWLEHFRPMRFGQRLWICPTGFEVDAPDSTVVELDPGLAFGTGTHATTRLCLEWLDSANLKGRSLIDFGCGSGILAIAALKLGVREAVAIDHDPQALLATHSNALNNQVAQQLTTLDSDAPCPAAADIVVANILANVLIELAPQIGSLVHPGGHLVLSGILQQQADQVAQAYAARFNFSPAHEQDGWILLEGTAS